VSRPRLSGRILNRRILNRRILNRRVLPALAAVLVVGFAPTAWLWLASAAHMGGSSAPVVIVFGAQLTDDGTQPKPFLKGRLDAAVSAVTSGRAKVVLVSGDEHGTSGNEVAAMTRYLQDAGIPLRHIVSDGAGLDTYDTCRRAHDVFGVRKALLASQEFHLHRAVTLCRSLGIDADGAAAACTDCRETTLLSNRAREVPAAWKTLYDRIRHRPPAIASPPSTALADALAA
jgi:vancomycin permeability regulator SanA